MLSIITSISVSCYTTTDTKTIKLPTTNIPRKEMTCNKGELQAENEQNIYASTKVLVPLAIFQQKSTTMQNN